MEVIIAIAIIIILAVLIIISLDRARTISRDSQRIIDLNNISEALELFKSSGAIDYCTERMNYYTKAAEDSLSKLDVSEAREDLTELSDFIIKREF